MDIQIYLLLRFGGFPYPNPKFAILIVFDGVSEEYSGGNLSALVFSKFLNQVKKILFSSDYIQKINLKEKIPLKEIHFKNYEIPDFKNFSLRDVIYWKEKVLEPYNQTRQNPIILEIYGSGYVIKQIPQKHTSLKDITKIQIYLSEE